MTLENKKRYIIIFSIITILDQISKIVIIDVFNGNPFRVIDIIDGFFRIRYVENSGAVWGLFADAGHAIVPKVITALSILALLVVLYYFLKIEKSCPLELTSLAFIIGGALGNIIDRLYQGYVVDFIDLYIKNHHWPTFNISDLFISLGVFLLIISIWRGKCTRFS